MLFAGVVVLYNPDNEVLENINSYVNDLKVLYVVDNSLSKNELLIEKIKALPNVRYVDNNGNKGIAQALNVGAKKALQKGAVWLLTMDQDSRFEADNLQKLLTFTKEHDVKKVGLTSPFHKSVIIAEKKGALEELLFTMTSGNFISLYAYERIGGFDERFFIDAVDWDYGIRLNEAGFKVLRLNTAVLKHELGNHARKITTFFGKERLIQNYSKFRRYYITRNKLLIAKLHGKKHPNLAFRWRISILADIRNILLYENNKLAKIGAIIAGIRDYIRGRFYAK